MTLLKEKYVEMYEMMIRIRRFEETAIEVFKAGKIPGFIHSYIGEEAIAAGVCAVLENGDYITSTHRGHGHCLAKGMKMDRMMAELFGKATGYNRGKGGSMHIADFSCGVLGCFGLVGGGIGVATGAAWDSQYHGNGRVAVCFLGDGATNRGSFHEAVNMAAIWSLPVVYVVEANNWAISMPTSGAVNLSDLSARATGYGIPGISVNGYDVLAVYEAARAAVDRARRGEGPTLLVCHATRIRAHDEGDQQPYRPSEDIEEAKRNDPIPAFRQRLLERAILTGDELAEIEARAEAEARAAVVFADESPYPDPSEAFEYVFTS
jgi:TPP-dependent pyruvate/acetoin dehydrogenase alpha subunit